VRELPLQDLRRRVAVVPQETFLFSVSVAENLAYGCPDSPAEAIHHITHDTCLWESIQSFPHGLATLVGERGITLSGGQKQRVALARALLYGGEVLVLDDPFSNVDAETEQRLLATVCAAVCERFVLLIAHRIKTLQAAGRIDEVLGRLYDQRIMRRLLAYVRPYTLHFILAAALLMLWSAAQLTGPYLIKVAIDRYILQHARAGLGLLTVLYLFALLVAAGVRSVQIMTLSYMSQRVMFDLRMQSFAHLQTLSVGKKRLLSLTRALAHNPEILILDEATSSVDGEIEAMIQEGIKKLLAHRTALVIAHRLSTIREMDRILVLDHGRLVEEESHEQLLAAGSLYAKLYRLQFAVDSFGPSNRSTSLSDTPVANPTVAPSLAPQR
jgi:ABC-type multidrug transport system fused ATPase/permease subunit